MADARTRIRNKDAKKPHAVTQPVTRPALAKITVPSLQKVYARKRLFSLLDRTRRQRIVWIWGPPGSGKTTLAASYVKSRKIVAPWYHLDEGDADPASFFYYLRLVALRTLGQRCPVLPLFTPEYFQGLPTFARRFFQHFYTGLKFPFVLVFDDYHEVSAGGLFHEVFKLGLDEIPHGGRAIVISRQSPPANFARLRVNQVLAVISWKDLQLSVKETAGFARMHRPKISSASIHSIHAATEGWAAGVALMLEGSGAADPVRDLALEKNRDTIFDYFAGEVYERADPSTQAFLLKTSVLPWMTGSIAQKLTGQTHATAILEKLSREQYFTERRVDRETVYRYHPLFRDALADRAKTYFSPVEYSRLKREAAALLADAGQQEKAVHLMRAAQDFNGLAVLILKVAPKLMAEGRSQTLAEWLSLLPKEVVESVPWLLFWAGASSLPVRPDESSAYFEKAFDGFKAQNDHAGLLLAWSGAVDTIIIRWAEMHALDRWIDELENLLREAPEFPSREIAERVHSSMFAALFYRQPHHELLPVWEERALAVFRDSQDSTLRVRTGANLLLYYMWIGNKKKCSALMTEVPKLLYISAREFPLAGILAQAMVASYAANFSKNFEQCMKAVDEGLRIAADTGIYVLSPMLIAQKMYGALFLRDHATAAITLRQIAEALPKAQVLHIGHYHYLAGWEAMLRGDLDAALSHAQGTLDFAERAGAPFPVALSHHAMANVLYERGQRRQVTRHLNKAHATGRSMNSLLLDYLCLLTRAHIALDQPQNERQCLIHLKKALAIARENDYCWVAWSLSSTMARLCVKALEAGIEVDLTRDLILRCQLVPERPPTHLENWPWAVKIITLGEFTILRYEEPIQFTRKIQRRPLDLLKVLIFLGGQNVGEEQISDTLWPEADGDAAHRAFDTTLHRLRKLIGIDTALSLKGRRLSLDPRYCWVDAWAFESLCQKSEDARKDGYVSQAINLSEKALQLYRGPFLGNDEGEVWGKSMRERLHKRYLQLSQLKTSEC